MFASSNSLFFFIDLIEHKLFIPSTLNEHLGFFGTHAIMNISAMQTFVRIFWDIYASLYVEYMSRSRTAK